MVSDLFATVGFVPHLVIDGSRVVALLVWAAMRFVAPHMLAFHCWLTVIVVENTPQWVKMSHYSLRPDEWG